MTMPRIIGITGLAGAGKDTLADALVSDRRATKYNFALPIKQGLNAMFGWTMEQWEDRVWKEQVQPWLGKSPRQLAQTLGTEWGREVVNQKLWLLLAEQRFKESLGTFVIPDVRFENEADLIHTLGGVLIQIVRPGVGAVSAHKSEAGIDPNKIDLLVMNDSNMRAFVQNTLVKLDHWSAT